MKVVTRWSPGCHPGEKKEEKMLTRLADKIEKDKDGKDVRIIRYGMWARTAEIEKRKREYLIVCKGKTLQTFDTLEEASIYLEQMRR